MDQVSRWRQRIDQLSKIRRRLESQLMRPRAMRIGSVVKQYMFCGRGGCEGCVRLQAVSFAGGESQDRGSGPGGQDQRA